MRRPATNAQYVAHAGRVFASHLVTFATVSCSLRLAAPNLSSQSCQNTASTPPVQLSPAFCLLYVAQSWP
eukprot:11868538-Ditylum_brightwellii.AAC.1